ncbi:MAG TPA: 1,2-phenylacetyl-CoA epoxidase subunit PaaB [Acidimicrobiia bacterium]|nr:1,2-phenylacetyl-CoA epoxidase subunit PaaB [Acidimicrobiia bacterium]
MSYDVPHIEGEAFETRSDTQDGYPLWEVFVRQRRGLSHVHSGSLHAPDAETALQAARDVYTRRQEGVSIWVVPSSAIHAFEPEAAMEYYEASEKVYRHATHYQIPDEVGQM